MSDKLKDTFNFFIVPLQVLKDKQLTIHEKMVYMVLRSFVNPHQETVWPSYNLIADLGSMSRNQAIKVVASLIEKGYIHRERKLDYNAQKKKVTNDNNRYTLNLPSAQDAPVHDVHHPSAHGAPPLVHDVHHPSAHGAPELDLLTRSNKQKDDDDRLRLIDSVFDQFKDEITRDKFNTVVKRVRQRKVNNFEAFLVKAVQTEIANMQAAASSENQTGTPKRSKGNKRPQMHVVTNDSLPAQEITPEAREQARELARKLRDDNRVPVGVVVDEENLPFS